MRSIRAKSAICAFVASLGAVAQAEQLIVFEAPLDSWRKEISANFAVNRELGRAWIDVQVESPTPGEEPPNRQVISKTVEGLSYDLARKQVLYRSGAESIVCAEDARLLWRTYLKTTGQCLLTPLYERRKLDDGFKIREGTVAKVAFETQPATPDVAALTAQLTGAEISLQQALAAGAAEGTTTCSCRTIRGPKRRAFSARCCRSFAEIASNRTGN